MAKLHTLVDNFNDNSIDTGVWAPSATGVAETGGRVVLTPATTTRVLSTTVLTYDATSSQVVAQIPVVTATGTTGSLQCGMGVSDGTDEVVIRKVGSQLICSQLIGGVTTELSFTPYNATNHLWWRIRLDASNVYWETSTNGTGWFIQNTASIASLSAINFTAVGLYFFTNYSGVEASPGTFAIETVNPILLRDVAGNPAPSFTGQSVTNNTTTTHQITGTGSTGATTGTAALTIIAAGSGSSIRDAAGNLAAGYTNQSVTNNTVTVTHSISGSGTSLFLGAGGIQKVLALSATGTSGRGISYDESITYDSEILYDPNFTAGSAALTVLPAGVTQFLTASGLTTTSGSGLITSIPPGGISANGVTLFAGSAVLSIPVVGISGSGVTTTTGTASLWLLRSISGSGSTTTSGDAALLQLTRLFTFEPPVVYDLPPTLPDPRPRYINAHARWKGGQRRGRSVLKTGSVYTVVDTPTVDQINSADIAYQGGHVYTIDQDEAFDLIAAGFTVTGFEPFPTPDPTSGFPGPDLYPADTLYPAT